MRRIKARLAAPLWCVLTILWCAAAPLETHGADEVGPSGKAVEAGSARHFETQIAPLLTRHCAECHGVTSKKGRLDLSRKELAFAGGDSGPSIVPGNAAESLLWEYVESDEMPENRPPLSPQEKEMLRKWIDDGAMWPEQAVVGVALEDDVMSSNWVRRLTVPEYIQTVRQTVGVDVEREARRLLPRDLRADGFSNTAYNLSIDLAHVEAYAKLAEIIVGRMDIAAFAAEHAPCQELSEECRAEAIAEIGKWLLRGPLEQHELAVFVQLAAAVADEGGDFDEVLAYTVEAMLQSPRFLYLMEKQRGDAGEQRVGDYELASRLSYILWGGPPDKELMRVADAGKLANRGELERQVRRMLEDPRTVERSSQFISEWLNLEQLDYLRPNSDRFPRWNAAIAADMREETLAYFNEIVWQQKRPLWDLMNAQVTFATPRLAEHYGLDARSGVAEPEASVLAGGEDRAAATGKNPRAADGLQARYRFDEGSGERVRDSSGVGEPLDLKIEDAGAVSWSHGGLTINGSTRIATAKPAKRMIEAIKKSRAITLEAWITPDNTAQNGPARIATLSSNSGARNFTLGQEGNKYDVRLRTTKTDGNGMPGLASPSGAVKTQPSHIVYTRGASGKARLYVDGQESSARDVEGNLANWDGDFRFAVANELSKDRPWKGTLHAVAVYSRDLSAEEVRRNKDAGAREENRAALLSSASSSRSYDADLQALYRFDEGAGQTVRDTSGSDQTLDLKIENPADVSWGPKGLTVKKSTRIASDGPPERLTRAVQESNAITLEAWITPANDSQDGPARIITLSSGTGQRNFTLGQDGNKYEARLRATTTDANGVPGLASPSGRVVTQPTHVVYTRDSGAQARLFIDGVEVARRYVQGDLSNWAGGFTLALANESSGDRPWLGTLHRVAIYSRALTPQEALANSRINTPLKRYDLASVPGRGGLLTQGSVLTIGGDDASMVTRGLFVLKDVLYDRVGDPPPCLDTTPVPTKAGLSQREIAMQRVKSVSCGGCHSRFEPLAFGLEKFDGVGSYQKTDEHGNKLREDGEIDFPDQDEPVSYQSSAELMDLLAESARVRKNFTRKVTQFALGRPLVEADSPIVDKIHQTAQEGGGTYASLITAIVMSDLVQMTSLETER